MRRLWFLNRTFGLRGDRRAGPRVSRIFLFGGGACHFGASFHFRCARCHGEALGGGKADCKGLMVPGTGRFLSSRDQSKGTARHLNHRVKNGKSSFSRKNPSKGADPPLHLSRRAGKRPIGEGAVSPPRAWNPPGGQTPGDPVRHLGRGIPSPFSELYNGPFLGLGRRSCHTIQIPKGCR